MNLFQLFLIFIWLCACSFICCAIATSLWTEYKERRAIKKAVENILNEVIEKYQIKHR